MKKQIQKHNRQAEKFVTEAESKARVNKQAKESKGK